MTTDYTIVRTGVRFTGTLFSVGSGSPYAYGVLDQGWRWDLTDDEAFDLAQRSIYHATFRDAGSGGFVRSTRLTLMPSSSATCFLFCFCFCFWFSMLM